MSRPVQAMFSLLLVATYVAMVLAREPQPQQNFPTIPGFPGLLPPGVPSLLPPGLLPPPVDPVDIEKCWSSLQNIPGCAFEITNSIFTGRFGLGPACCKGFTAIDQNCWGKMFPLFPAVPPLIKSSCDQASAPPPRAV